MCYKNDENLIGRHIVSSWYFNKRSRLKTIREKKCLINWCIRLMSFKNEI